MEYNNCYTYDTKIHIEENHTSFRGCFSEDFTEYNTQLFQDAIKYNKDGYNYYEFNKNNTDAICVFDKLFGFKENSLTDFFKFKVENNFKDKVKSSGLINDSNKIEIGQYPREIYRDRQRGILINDYSEKTICIHFSDYKFKNNWFQQNYHCLANNLLGDEKNYKVEYGNELLRIKGYNIVKSFTWISGSCFASITAVVRW